MTTSTTERSAGRGLRVDETRGAARTAPVLAALLGLAVMSLGACVHPQRAEQPAPRESIELWLAGDVHLGAQSGAPLVALSHQLGPGEGVVNLEGPLGEGAAQSHEGRLVNAPEVARMLHAAEVIAAGIANNHAEDLGPSGAQRTRQLLEAEGVEAIGGARFATLRSNGLVVAITQHDLSKGLPSHLREELRTARTNADVLVATFHVQGPSSYLPSKVLKEAVQAALDAGAQVVTAHGTHALARVERRGSAVIAWGLGNLTFGCPCGRSDEGLALHVTLTRDQVLRAEIIPLDPGTDTTPPALAADPAFAFEQLRALGSSPLHIEGARASF